MLLGTKLTITAVESVLNLIGLLAALVLGANLSLLAVDADLESRANFIGCGTHSKTFREFLVWRLDRDHFNFTIDFGTHAADLREPLLTTGDFYAWDTPLELEAALRYIQPLFPTDVVKAWKLHPGPAKSARERCQDYDTDLGYYFQLRNGMCVALLCAIVIGSTVLLISLSFLDHDDPQAFVTWMIFGKPALAMIFALTIFGFVLNFHGIYSVLYMQATSLVVAASNRSMMFTIFYILSAILSTASVLALPGITQRICKCSTQVKP